MKIVQINSTCGAGSTGKICVSVSKLLNERKIENYILYSTGKSNNENGIKYCNKYYQKIQAFKGRVFGNNGFNSHFSTFNLIKKMKEIDPDVVHLHNLHSNDINLAILFGYLRKANVKVYYTFHDCWAFTGYCTHFMYEKCDGYKTICHNCPNRKKSSWFFDRSTELQRKKLELLNGVHPIIITPSKWLKDIVMVTKLNSNPVIVIHNGIDINVFKPTLSDFRTKYNIENKQIILGVSYGWGFKKGLDVFIELSQTLPNDYQIVLVGGNDKVDKQIPSNIISIHRTNCQKELAEIYSSADVFFNPTREENYPTVNMESLACGTPVITFNTGGSSEIIDDKSGIVVSGLSMDENVTAIKNICENHIIKREDCIERAKTFDMNDRFKEYVDLYENIFFSTLI